MLVFLYLLILIMLSYFQTKKCFEHQIPYPTSAMPYKMFLKSKIVTNELLSIPNNPIRSKLGMIITCITDYVQCKGDDENIRVAAVVHYFACIPQYQHRRNQSQNY